MTTEKDPNVLFFVDSDIDRSASIFTSLITAQNGAFAQPSEICKKIALADPGRPIRVVINTLGGALVSTEKILKKLKKHPKGYIVYVRNECYSAGSLIALGGDKIVMNDDSYIGKIDPQSDQKSVVVYLQIDPNHVDSRNAFEVETATNIVNYTEKILGLTGLPANTLKKVKQQLLYSRFPHEALFGMKDCKKMGLNVCSPNTEEEIYFSPILEIPKETSWDCTKWACGCFFLIVSVLVLCLFYKVLA